MENIFINPFNYLAFDVMFFLPLDIFNINFALLVPIIPSLMNKKYRLYTFSNYYFNSIRDYSVIPSSPVINDLSNPKLNNDLRKLIGGGYTSYKNVISLGYLNVLLENKPILLKNLFNYLEKLENNKCFTLLPVIRWIDDDTGFSKSITITNSIKITKFVDIDLLAERLNDSMFKAMNKYDVNNSNSELVLMNREWLDIKDFNIKNDDFSTITNTIDNILSIKKSNNIKDELIMNKLSTIDIDKYNHIMMDNYGTPIKNNGNTNDFKLNNNQYISVKKGNNDSNYITVKNFDNNDQNLIQWIDTKSDFGFIRKKDSFNYFFNKKGEIFKTEASYNFLDYPMDNIHDELDIKIGAIDFETFGNEGIGIQQVYAAGWAINDWNKSNNLYYIEKDGNSLDLVKNLINDLANNKDINGYTFYAHNLGRFDAVFLIKACLLLDDIDIKPKWKDNKILSITILNTKNKCKFKILDSIQILNGSLDSLCKSFNIINQKGIFPHNFVNKDRLFYVGDTPDLIHFKYMPVNLYNKIKSNNWDLKSEALIYLKKDIIGLLEVMVKFNEKIYNLYSLNITSYPTAAKLAVGIFTTNFFKNYNDLKIKMIRGNVEADIRSAYFGGNVNVLINKMDQGFYYDMNSQYPYAMLNDMPIGNPTFSNDTDLNNYFGFVYGEITAPDYERLRVPYIQMRDDTSDNIDCPRGTFSRMIFSEEIKEALKDGYSINIKYGYKFERGKDLFKDYVTTIYNIKKITKDPVEKAISKLLLNSLYGKFGMKDIISNMKIVNQNEAKKITNNYNYSLFADLGNGKHLIKYSTKLHDSLRKLVKDSKDSNKDITLNSISRKRGVPSAVHISAAISAYARIAINKYKNIPGNPCIMSDTDSVVLPYKLPDICIGKELGQMKLEHQILEGIFIRKKLYALKTLDNNEIIKSSGVKNTSLNYDKFKLLLSGESVKTNGISFNVIWKDLNIDIVNKSIILKGLQHKIIDINDHYDINFKKIIPYSPPIHISSQKNIKFIDIIRYDIANLLKKYIFVIWKKLLRIYHYIYIHIKDLYQYFKER